MKNLLGDLPPLSRFKPFEAAARHESFSLAADELGLTQAAVSKQIAQLEDELGLRLFERRNRAVFLTEAGRRLGRVVGEALSSIAAEAAVLRGPAVGGELVLHCQLCEALYWLMPRLALFHERYPGTELRVVSSLKPITQAAEEFDVAIQTSSRASGTARLAFTASDDVFPVCSPSLIPAEHLPVDPYHLSGYPLLSHRAIPRDWMEWEDWFDAIGKPVPKAARFVHFDSYPVALQAAVAGQGVALGWRRTTEVMVAEGKLVRPCAESILMPSEISVFRGVAGRVHADTDKLLQWLSEELSG